MPFCGDFGCFNGKKDIKFHASTVDNMAIKTSNSCALLWVQTNHVQTITISTANSHMELVKRKIRTEKIKKTER